MDFEARSSSYAERYMGNLVLGLVVHVYGGIGPRPSPAQVCHTLVCPTLLVNGSDYLQWLNIPIVKGPGYRRGKSGHII